MKLKVLACAVWAMAGGLALGQSGEIVTVKGRGVGEDMAAALKDAYRDAIETAVGLYVDAEQMVKNDELLRDQVLTQSNAYIEGYDVLSKKVGDGLVSIKILARVRSKTLTKKVSGFMKPRTVEVGSALRDQFAKSQTVRKRGEDGAALVKKALVGLELERQTMDCWLAHPDGEVVNDDGKSSSAELRYLFGYRVNEERFFALTAALCEVLDQVAIEEPTDILIPVERGEPFVYDARRAHNTGTAWDVKILARLNGQGLLAGGAKTRIDPASGVKISPLALTVVTGVNKLRTVYKARQYRLDEHSGSAVRAWYRENYPDHPNASKDTMPRFRVTFNGEGNELLFQDTVAPGGKSRISCCDLRKASVRSEGEPVELMVVKPWFPESNLLVKRAWYGENEWEASERYVWTGIRMPRNALQEIKSITIEAVK